jgi:hypothetical protein
MSPVEPDEPIQPVLKENEKFYEKTELAFRELLQAAKSKNELR